MKIYGIPQSRAGRCLWMARELGLEHENVPVHFRATRDSPELVKVNPNARIPALEEPGGFTLHESMAINLYLVMTEIEKPLLTLLMNTLGMSPETPEAVAKAEADLARPLDVLEAHLAGQDWLVGGRFTVADLNVASVLAWARGAKLDLSARPHVEAWLKRCLGRPAFKG